MSARAERLAEEFAQANDALVQVLEQATPEQWRQRTRDEGELRPIGVIAHHVAWAHQHINLERRACEDPGAPELTTREVIELRQIGHVRGHLATIRTALRDSLRA